MDIEIEQPSQAKTTVIPTLQPYEPPSASRGRTNRNNRRPDRGGRSRLDFDQLFGPARDFARFHCVTAVSGENLAEIDTIKASDDLEKCLGGSPRKVVELRSGQLLVEVNSEEQLNAIKRF
jgi:hypothetical protein